MMAELHDVVDALEHDSAFADATVLLVKGTSDFFCAGADLAVLGGFSREEGLHMSELMQHSLERLRGLPLVSVAAVNGGAVGGGTELALSCDLRVFQDGAVFQMVQTKLGLVPGWGGGSRLVQVVGRRAAMQILCSGRRLSTAEALQFGIADGKGQPGETAEDAATRFVQDMIDARYPQAVRESKKLLGFASDAPSMSASLDFERAAFGRAWQGDENLDALSRIAKRSGTKPAKD